MCSRLAGDQQTSPRSLHSQNQQCARAITSRGLSIRASYCAARRQTWQDSNLNQWRALSWPGRVRRWMFSGWDKFAKLAASWWTKHSSIHTVAGNYLSYWITTQLFSWTVLIWVCPFCQSDTPAPWLWLTVPAVWLTQDSCSSCRSVAESPPAGWPRYSLLSCQPMAAFTRSQMISICWLLTLLRALASIRARSSSAIRKSICRSGLKCQYRPVISGPQCIFQSISCVGAVNCVRIWNPTTFFCFRHKHG